MENENQNKKNINGFLIALLLVIVLFLLGIMGYAYYTKDMVPKNKIVQLFSSTTQDTNFNDTQIVEQEKYTSKADNLDEINTIDKQKDKIYSSAEESIEEEPSVKNDFLKKMALSQKDNDERLARGEESIEEESSVKNDFLKKMALSQKDNDARLARGEESIEEESSVKNEFLKKMALSQKDNDDMIISESGKKLKDVTQKDRLKYKTYTCTKFKKGSINVPKVCKNELYSFLDKYKDKAQEFEIIGMVDNAEFKLIRNLEEVYGSTEVKEVKKYVQIGLSRQRVIEVTWLAREYLKKGTKIKPVNYTVHNNNRRGFVIRAYY